MYIYIYIHTYIYIYIYINDDGLPAVASRSYSQPLKGLLVGVSKPVITGAAQTKHLLTYLFTKEKGISEGVSNDWFRHPCYWLFEPQAAATFVRNTSCAMNAMRARCAVMLRCKLNAEAFPDI